MEKPLDRRIQKTRILLSDALNALILEKGYDAVTVQDIIDRANVGRSTFYAHFENKEHLLLSGRGNFQKLLAHPEGDGNEDETGLKINLRAFFEHIAENHKLAKAMMVDGNDQLVIRFFHANVAVKIKDYLKQQAKLTIQQQEYTAEAAAAAILSLVSIWLEKGLKNTPAEMAETARNLLLKMVG